MKVITSVLAGWLWIFTIVSPTVWIGGAVVATLWAFDLIINDTN